MQKICIPPHVSTTLFDESAIILDLHKNAYYALNDSAAEFWKFLMQLGSIESATEEVLKLYGKSSDAIKKDMEELANSLVQIGLLEEVQSGA